MTHRAVLALLALGACGRIGFEAAPSDGGDADSMGSVSIPLALPGGGQFRQIRVASDNAWYAASVSGRIFRQLAGENGLRPCAPLPGNGFRSGVSTAGANVYATGDVAYASTDHCASWQDLGVGVFTYQIVDIGGVRHALTSDGLYREGTPWTKVTTPVGGSFVTYASRAGATPLTMIGTRTQGVLASANGGVTWTNAQAGLTSVFVQGVAVGATKTYAIEQANNQNRSDIVVGNANATVFTQGHDLGGIAIAVDPGDENHVLAAIYDNLAETFDGFATAPTLERRRDGMLDEAIVYGITFTPDRQILVASNRGVFRSAPATTLAALDFTSLNDNVDGWEPNAMLRDGNDVFISTSGGLLSSVGGGAFTVDTSTLDTNTAFSTVTVADNGDLWGTGRGVWHSVDRGKHWDGAFYFDAPDNFFGFSIATKGTTVYTGTYSRVLYSSPPYSTWTPIVVPAGTAEVDALLVVGNELWIGSTAGVFMTANDGGTFVHLVDITGTATSFASLSDGRLLVGTSTGLFLSTDATRTAFTQVITAQQVFSITVDGGDIILGTSDGVRVSHDTGASWLFLANGSTVRGAILDPSDRSIIYSAYGRGLQRAALP